MCFYNSNHKSIFIFSAALRHPCQSNAHPCVLDNILTFSIHGGSLLWPAYRFTLSPVMTVCKWLLWLNLNQSWFCGSLHLKLSILVLRWYINLYRLIQKTNKQTNKQTKKNKNKKQYTVFRCKWLLLFTFDQIPFVVCNMQDYAF